MSNFQQQNRTFTHLWELTDVVQNQKIVYNWKYFIQENLKSHIDEICK